MTNSNEKEICECEEPETEHYTDGSCARCLCKKFKPQSQECEYCSVKKDSPNFVYHLCIGRKDTRKGCGKIDNNDFRYIWTCGKDEYLCPFCQEKSGVSNEDFNLSDEVVCIDERNGDYAYLSQDVKEFIKRLKEYLEIVGKDYIHYKDVQNKIDKLAGSKLAGEKDGK